MKQSLNYFYCLFNFFYEIKPNYLNNPYNYKCILLFRELNEINIMRQTAKIIGFIGLIVLICSFSLPNKNLSKSNPLDSKGNLVLNDSTDSDSIAISYVPFKENAHASYYHDKFNGRKTASGELFNNDLYTAAHKTLKFGTKIRVTNTVNDSSVIVIINDRGPFIKGREIDLSKKAFMEIAKFKQRGFLIVNIEIIKDSL